MVVPCRNAENNVWVQAKARKWKQNHDARTHLIRKPKPGVALTCTKRTASKLLMGLLRVGEMHSANIWINASFAHLGELFADSFVFSRARGRVVLHRPAGLQLQVACSAASPCIFVLHRERMHNGAAPFVMCHHVTQADLQAAAFSLDT